MRAKFYHISSWKTFHPMLKGSPGHWVGYLTDDDVGGLVLYTTMKVLTALLMKCISTTSTQTR